MLIISPPKSDVRHNSPSRNAHGIMPTEALPVASKALQSAGPTEFLLFPKLPLGIRQKIWSLALFGFRFYKLIDEDFVGFRGLRFKESLEEGFRQSKIRTSISRVCQEAREEFLRHYDLGLLDFLSPPNHEFEIQKTTWNPEKIAEGVSDLLGAMRKYNFSIPDYFQFFFDRGLSDEETGLEIGGFPNVAIVPCEWVYAIYRHKKGDVMVRICQSIFYLHCLTYRDVEFLKGHASSLKHLDISCQGLEQKADSARQFYCDWEM